MLLHLLNVFKAVAAALDRGMAAFAEIYGDCPHGFAAPAWFMTDDAFLALEARGFDYLSVSRGVAEPFYPRIRGKVLKTLEIPTTLPTLDEELGSAGITPETKPVRILWFVFRFAMMFIPRRPARHVFGFRVGNRCQYRDPIEVRRKLAEADSKWSALVDHVVKSSKPTSSIESPNCRLPSSV